MASAVTIDLGEVGPAPAEVPAPTGLSPRHRRLLAVLAAILASVLGLGGAGRPPPALGDPLWTVEVSLAGYSLGAQSAYVSDPGARAVTGRWLGNGRTRWRLELYQYLDFTEDLGNGIAAVMSHDSRSPSTTTLVDERTGRVLARHGGVPVGWTAGGLLLLNEYPVSCVDNGPCMVMAAIEPRAGVERWRIGPSVEPIWLMDTDALAVRRIATVGADGALATRDPETGRVVATTPPGTVPVTAQAVLAGDTIVTAMAGVNRVLVAGRALGPFGRTWSVPLHVVGPVDEYGLRFGLLNCGELICVLVNDGTAVIDPATGALLFWDRVDIVGPFAGGLLATPARREADQPQSAEVRVLDPRSGATIRTVAGRPVEWSASAGRALVSSETLTADRTAFTVLDERGVPHPVGTVQGVGLDCRATGDKLACAGPAGTLRVWRLPRL